MVIVIDLESGEVNKSSTNTDRMKPTRTPAPAAQREPELQPVSPEPIRQKPPPPTLPIDLDTWLEGQ